eukprot:scaffold5186_cov179-Ochromonas_danica.AAC.1
MRNKSRKEEEDEEEDEEEEEGSPGRKVAKKKYYPFGTPSHLHHAYSEFAHITVANRDFAIQLATASDIKPEVVVEEEKPKKRRPAIVRKKAADDNNNNSNNGGGSGGGGDDSKATEEELQPCTKMACILVVRALADMEYRNEVERLDLEDEFEAHVKDLRATEVEVQASDDKLDKLNDMGNQLEMLTTQLLAKVTTLEETREALNAERTEINTKLMLLEVEKQKAARKLEKAQKNLADARWKKKKAAMAAIMDIEGGISLAHSTISDGPIYHHGEEKISESAGGYLRLAKQEVVDVTELPPHLVTVTETVQEKFFLRPESFDKYSHRYYEKVMQHSVESWQKQSGSLLASSLSAAQHALNAHQTKAAEEDRLANRRSRQAQRVLHQSYSSLPSTMGSFQPANNASSTSLSKKSSLTKKDPSVHRSRDLEAIESVQSVYERSAKAGLVSPVRDSTTSLQLSLSLPNLSSNTSQVGIGEGGMSPDGSTLDAPFSTMSMESEDAVLEQLAEAGIYIDPQGRAQQKKKRLDATFYNDSARHDFGRSGTLGRVREKEGRALMVKAPAVEEETNKTRRTIRRAGSNRSDALSMGAVDLRKMPKLTSQVLTTKHPGMTTFAQAATMSMIK